MPVNLETYGDMEDATHWSDGWDNANATVTRRTTSPLNDTAHARIVATGGAATTIYSRGPKYTCAPGDIVSAGIDLAMVSGSSIWQLQIEYFNGASSLGSDSVTLSGATGTKARFTLVGGGAPALTTHFCRRVRRPASGGVIGDAVDFDNVMVTRGSYVGPWTPPGKLPNIVEILADDMSMNLLQHMPRVQSLLVDHGVSFSNFYVSTPICMPSRAAFLIGWQGHHSNILQNADGWSEFVSEGHEARTVAALLTDYRNHFAGKYLNHYDIGVATEAPEGWNHWLGVDAEVSSNQFKWEALSDIDGTVTTVSKTTFAEANFMADYITERMVAAIEDNAINHADDPWYFKICPYTPHENNDASVDDPDDGPGPDYPVAPRHRPSDTSDWSAMGWDEPLYPEGDCGGTPDGGCAVVPWPDPAGADWHNVRPSGKPGWMKSTTLSPTRLGQGYDDHKDRIRAMQAIDEQVEAVYDAIEAAAELDNTWFIFSSDNGLHIWEHGQDDGKSTAYDYDTRLPLIIRPPGGMAPTVVDVPVSNVDLLPTYLEIAGVAAPSDLDGRSLVGHVSGEAFTPARAWALMQYQQPDPDDFEDKLDTDGVPPWLAARSPELLFVDYGDGDPNDSRSELYYVLDDPWFMNNRWSEIALSERTALLDVVNAARIAEGDVLWDALSVPLPVPEAGAIAVDVPPVIKVMQGWIIKLLGADMFGNVSRHRLSDERLFASVFLPPGTSWNEDTTLEMDLRHQNGVDAEVFAAEVVGTPAETTIIRSADAFVLDPGVWRVLVNIDRGANTVVVDVGYVVSRSTFF